MNKILISICFIGFAFCIQAQELLTPEQAVKLALKNNYSIRMSSNDLDIDKENVSIGNAGMLPQVTASVDDNNRIQNSTQTRSDGTVNALDDAKNNSLSYGVALDWTLFDGLKMFARYDQLQELQKLGEVELKQNILTNVSAVLVTYFDLVQQQQQLSALDSTLVISKQRVDLAHNRYIIGKASKLDELNAKVDLTTDQTTFLRQKELYNNTKSKLNELLARDIKTDFVVANAINVDYFLKLETLEAQAKTNNPELLIQIINKQIAELELKQIKADRYPVIGATTGYNFSETESSLGFTSSTSARGWNYGFRVSMNIFDGFNQSRNEKVAKMQIEGNDLAIAQQKQTLLTQLNTSYQTYLTNLNLIELESSNESIAKENLEITMEKYRIGTIPAIEFRTAQLNYINAQLRYSNAVFQAKLSEISLKALSGGLSYN